MIEGAQVLLENSLIDASSSEIGLLARDNGTHVEAVNSIILDGKQGVSAQGGALISLRDCSCSGASVVGVEAREEGSRIELRGSFVGDMKGAGAVSDRTPTPRLSSGMHSHISPPPRVSEPPWPVYVTHEGEFVSRQVARTRFCRN